MDTILRRGKKEDIESLIALNHLWFRPNLDNCNHGFLSITYDKDFFGCIINNDDIIVFENYNRLVGYVLVNTVIQTQHISTIKNLYFELKPELDVRKIAFSYQILVDKDLQGTGFFYQAQDSYFKHFRTKYDLLVSTVNRDNIRSIHAHRKAGWSFIETDKHFFLIEKPL